MFCVLNLDVVVVRVVDDMGVVVNGCNVNLFISVVEKRVLFIVVVDDMGVFFKHITLSDKFELF